MKKDVRPGVALVFWGTLLVIFYGMILALAVASIWSNAGKWAASFTTVALAVWFCWAFTRPLSHKHVNRMLEKSAYDAALRKYWNR